MRGVGMAVGVQLMLMGVVMLLMGVLVVLMTLVVFLMTLVVLVLLCHGRLRCWPVSRDPSLRPTATVGAVMGEGRGVWTARSCPCLVA